MAIQYINYKGEFSSTAIKANKISAPESFDDYECNIIDLSGDEIWRYKEAYPSSINCIDDIRSLSAMINATQNKVLIVLPQNIKYKYSFSPYASKGNEYFQDCELKNKISLVSTVLETLLGDHFDKAWLMYNKTKSNIQGHEMSCDFVFHNIRKEQAITLSNNGTSITTMSYMDSYLTTLRLKSESDVFAMMQELKWSQQSEAIPEWINDIDYFDDEVLKNQKQSKSEELANLQHDIQIINERLLANREYKTVLCKSGDELVDIVNKMLNAMIGYDYEKFVDKKEEDFLIQYKDRYFIGEIKGISTNVKRSNILQAAMHKSLFMEIEGNENKDAYAIAIINRQRNTPPLQRDNITSDVIQLAKSNNVLLITTESLLQLFELYKNGKYSTEDVANLLTQNTGLLEIKTKD